MLHSQALPPPQRSPYDLSHCIHKNKGTIQKPRYVLVISHLMDNHGQSVTFGWMSEYFSLQGKVVSYKTVLEMPL